MNVAGGTTPLEVNHGSPEEDSVDMEAVDDDFGDENDSHTDSDEDSMSAGGAYDLAFGDSVSGVSLSASGVSVLVGPDVWLAVPSDAMTSDAPLL